MKGRNVYSLDTPYAQQKTAQQAADKAYARKIHKHRFLAMIGIIGVLFWYLVFRSGKTSGSLAGSMLRFNRRKRS